MHFLNVYKRRRQTKKCKSHNEYPICCTFFFVLFTFEFYIKIFRSFCIFVVLQYNSVTNKIIFIPNCQLKNKLLSIFKRQNLYT